LDRTTGNVVGAAFVHTTSRALDPQLHTHFVLFNSTWDNKERRWKALQTGEMFGAINYATEAYRNELVKRLHQIGYQTRKARNGFEIEGVEQKFIERFSKRSQQRDMTVKRRARVALWRRILFLPLTLSDLKPFARDYEPSECLGPDQRKALAHILNSADRFTGFRGLVGWAKAPPCLNCRRLRMPSFTGR
jgi:hypothetical protein